MLKAFVFPEMLILVMHIGTSSGGAVDKNPPANAGTRDSIPGLRRLHMLQSY